MLLPSQLLCQQSHPCVHTAAVDGDRGELPRFLQPKPSDSQLPSFCRSLASCQSVWQVQPVAEVVWWREAEVWPAEAASWVQLAISIPVLLPAPACWWGAAADCLAGLPFSPGEMSQCFADLSFSRLKKSECSPHKERFSLPFLFPRGPLEVSPPSPATQQPGHRGCTGPPG